MASENSSEKPSSETKQNPEQETKKLGDGVGRSLETNKAGDDTGPGKKIQEILEIVENLHKIFPSQSEEERTSRGMLDKSKSVPANTKNQSMGALETAKSLQANFAKQGEAENTIPKLQRNLRLLKEDVIKVHELNEEVREDVSRHIDPLQKLLDKVKKDSSKNLTKGMQKDLEDVNKKIFNLMFRVPLLPNRRKTNKGLDAEDGLVDNGGKGIVCLPGIHANEKYLKSLAVFRDVLCKFKELADRDKICLLSFAVFPENQEVNRTMLMYWWIGEGIILNEGKPEDVVKEILITFTKMKLIEPVENKRKVEPNSYKMTPFVHASVVRISMEMNFFDIYEEGKKPTMKRSKLNKMCLVEGSSSQQEAKANKMKEQADLIETVFNVSERFPDFTFKWFSQDQPSTNKRFGRLTTYKALKVFYLGRWERTAKRHIEVENPELLKNLKHMTKLKLLSFQGISRIEKLHDAVCKHPELVILDLRACYNLEKLPDKIDSLKALTYLDITDCYMIDRMPKRLSWLDNLEVLKGFVVSDADEEKVCTLAELEHLKKLRKLSITINKGEDFSVDKLFLDIEGFGSLEKLKVAWGGINKQDKKATSGAAVQRGTNKLDKKVTSGVAEKKGTNKDNKKGTSGGAVKNFLRSITLGSASLPRNDGTQLPKNLKKLDLQCFPDAHLPSLLEPKKLNKLEKLYIKGGTELTGFGTSLLEEESSPEELCSVKVLRLKFLPRLKVEWRELREVYFPKLEFLDKYQCPQVSFCPCDGIGIWRKKT